MTDEKPPESKAPDPAAPGTTMPEPAPPVTVMAEATPPGATAPDPAAPDPAPPADAPGPSARQILEALLFASDDPLHMDRLAECAGLEDGREARVLLEDLRREYATTGRAFSLEEVAGGWQLLTRPVFAPHLARLRRRPDRARLTGAALETLAVIAYRQPVLRTDVERIRGVACGDMLRALMERDLVRIAGRAEEPGSPLLYGTTSRFLAEFGLRSLKDLPTARDLPPPAGVKIAGS